MTQTTAPEAPPLDEVMLAMDVVDTLRHRQDLALRELDGAAREKQLIEKLRDIYHQQGIAVPDHILKEGVEALAESRFVYTPPAPGLKTTLARLYVSRKRWGRWALAVLLALVLGLGGYFGVYRPIETGRQEAARVELTETMPAQMDALYNTIFEETKVQQAVAEAEETRTRGKTAASEGNREGAQAAIARLTEIRDTLRQEFTLRVVNKPDIQTGFWTFPDINTEATNYYIVVEAVAPNGEVLTLPILNEESGQTEQVSVWGVRVSEDLYHRIAADKRDDGIIQNNTMGVKQFGFLEVDYVMPVLGGAVTRW